MKEELKAGLFILGAMLVTGIVMQLVLCYFYDKVINYYLG